jgi:hypothetical protein
MMQRSIYALVAILSLFAANLRPTQAQTGHAEEPVQPSSTPQTIDQRDTGPVTVASSLNQAQAGELTVPANQTLDNLVVRNRRVVLSGHVLHDVLAINCDVIVKPGAEVGNYLNAVGGTVDNQAGDAVRVIRQDGGLATGLTGVVAVGVKTPRSAAPPPRQGWATSQLYLGVFGLLGGLILSVVAPHATRRTCAIAALERGRSLAIGIIGAAGIAVIVLCGSWLLKSPLHGLALPVIAGVDLLFAVAIAFGWLCGMAMVGEFLQERLRGHRSCTWYGQLATGLLAFCLVNLLLGGISSFLGGIGLFFMALFALMGLGAAVISGFGSDSNWLSARLQRDGSWFSRSSRL